VDKAGRAGGLLENAYLVENYPGLASPSPGPALAQRFREHLRRFGIQVELGTLERIERLGRDFMLSGSFAEVRARAVIIAVGTTPRPAGFVGEMQLSGKHVFYEVRKAAALTPKRAMVIGSGDAAFDYALSLAAGGALVSLCVRGGRPKAGQRLQRLVDEHARIRVGLHRQVLSATPMGPVLIVQTRTGQQEAKESTDVIVVAVGRASALGDLVPPSDLPPHIAVLRQELAPGWAGSSPESLRTAVGGLYIAGDARLSNLGQVGIAVGDGLACAALANSYVAEKEQ